ncbi:MAG: hypothetical protein KJI70_00930 [Patescibacteria group bacterium]|nr:hypothetical protein [Patescibacteria group bacterium]
MLNQKKLWKVKLSVLSLILLFLIALPVQAVLYNKNGFLLHGSSKEGWIFLTPKVDYFAMWLGEDLGAIWINKETRLSTCLTIRGGQEDECTLREFSILLANFPYELIEDLKKNQKN